MINHNDSFSYSGIIKVQVKYKNNIVNTTVYKNTGLLPMFYGIVSGLAGNFSQMSRYLPKYIKLYYTTNPLVIYDESDKLITPVPFFYTDTPYIKPYSESYDQQNKPLAEVTFKFNIPFSALNLTEVDSINKFCLCSDYNKDFEYNSQSQNEKDLFNAYFIATKPIDLKNISDIANYSLYLEWTIKIKNI